MKKLIVGLLLLLAPLAEAQNSNLGACPYPSNVLQARYSEMLTVSSTALPLTVATYRPGQGAPNAVCALIAVNTNSISWWAHGATPTASDGIINASATSISLGVNNMAQFKMIRATGTDAEVAIQYFVLTQ